MRLIGTCKDCKYYDKEKRKCLNKKFVEDELLDDNKDYLLYGGSYDSGEGWFEVGEAFGCIHYKNEKDLVYRWDGENFLSLPPNSPPCSDDEYLRLFEKLKEIQLKRKLKED